MSNLDSVKKLIRAVLFNSLWAVPVGLMFFARMFPEQFDQFWARLFGE